MTTSLHCVLFFYADKDTVVVVVSRRHGCEALLQQRASALCKEHQAFPKFIATFASGGLVAESVIFGKTLSEKEATKIFQASV